MPQRTNEFQDLVTSFHRMFAPEGAVITPSAMVKGLDGREREIDILIEIKEPLYLFRVAVEAKDLSRNLDITQIEGYIGKYNSPGGIFVNKVLIVGKGFTKAAVDRAAVLGFQLHTAKTLEETDQKTIFSHPPHEPPQKVSPMVGKEAVLCRWENTDGEEIKMQELLKAEFIHESSKFNAHQIACCINKTIDRFIEDVAKARSENKGIMLGGRLTIEFNHISIVHSTGRIGLKYVFIEVPPSMVFPDMDAREFTVVSDEIGEKGIVVSQFKNNFTQFRITYAKGDNDDLPKKMQIEEFQWSPQFIKGTAKIGGKTGENS